MSICHARPYLHALLVQTSHGNTCTRARPLSRLAKGMAAAKTACYDNGITCNKNPLLGAGGKCEWNDTSRSCEEAEGMCTVSQDVIKLGGKCKYFDMSIGNIVDRSGDCEDGSECLRLSEISAGGGPSSTCQISKDKAIEVRQQPQPQQPGSSMAASADVLFLCISSFRDRWRCCLRRQATHTC